MRSNRNCTVLPGNPRDFYEHQVPPSVQVAVLALHALIPTKMEHRYGDLGGESQFVSICFLGPEVLGGGIEVGRGLVLGSGLSSPLEAAVPAPTPFEERADCSSLPSITMRGPGPCSGNSLTLGIKETGAQLLTSWTKHLILWMEPPSKWWQE